MEREVSAERFDRRQSQHVAQGFSPACGSVSYVGSGFSRTYIVQLRAKGTHLTPRVDGVRPETRRCVRATSCVAQGFSLAFVRLSG
jgi:hypothetical protein